MLRAIFGTDTEMSIESERRFSEAERNIDAMAEAADKLREAQRPAANLDEAMRQITGSD